MRTVAVVAVLATVALPAFAQGSSSSGWLAGAVISVAGRAVPDATVVAQHNAMAGSYMAATDSSGRFVIPALVPGTYTVTISKTGSSTVVLPDVPIVSGRPASVRVILEAGTRDQTTTVRGGYELLQTQTSAISSAMTADRIQALPLPTRTALGSVVHMPGVETPGGTTRSSTITGLPAETLNITLDGVSAQTSSLTEAGGPFFAVRASVESIQGVTLVASGPEADGAVYGPTQIRIVTRAGSNRLTGSAYNTWRNQAGVASDDVVTRRKKAKWIWRLNTADWFNRRDLPRTAAGEYFIDDLRLQTPGFRAGGPIVTGRVFYFFSQEWLRLPSQVSRTRLLMSEPARRGIFTYPATDGRGNMIVDLLAIAAANGQVATMDPTVETLLADIRHATATEGAIERLDQNVDTYTYHPASLERGCSPTLRLDANVSSAHRLTVSARFDSQKASPDVLNGYESRFPGFPNAGSQSSQRYIWQGTLRSVLRTNLVSEAHVAYQDTTRDGIYYRPEVSASQFNCGAPGCQSAGGRGWALAISAFRGIADPTSSTSTSDRASSELSVEDTLTWLTGRHSVSVGAQWTRVTYLARSATVVPTVTFGLSPQDAGAYAMLDATAGTFPGGISATWAGDARDLYAVLTGRVVAISGTADLNSEGRYEYLGGQRSSARGGDVGFFVSDSWRARPNLTLTAGLRYVLQRPFSTDGSYTTPQTWQMVYGITGAGSGSIGQGNLYKPGVLAGRDPLVVPYGKDAGVFRVDWNNLAPSVGVVWRPHLRSPLAAAGLSTDPVFRAGYSMSYSRLGTNVFESTFGDNPGRSRSAARSTTTGAPLLGSDGLPVLLRDADRLFPSAFPDTPSYPIVPAAGESIMINHPSWSVPHTHQYSAGFQREIGKATAIEIRYAGNTYVGGWTSWDMTAGAQWSMLAGENGFYDEFRAAQANLRANVIAGVGHTFAYTGAPGTSPLPIFLAYLQGIPPADARNRNPARYTAPQFQSPSWINSLSMYRPALTTIAGAGVAGLQNAAFEANAEAAGLPANFFQANPALKQGSASLRARGGNTRYNSVQIELRQRMGRTLTVEGSYVFQFGRKTWSWPSLRDETWHYVDSTRGPVHALKVNWVFELPFGRDKRFGSGAPRWLENVIGGWVVAGAGRSRSGARFDYGGYRLVGMSEEEFARLFKLHKVPDEAGKMQIYMFPMDVIEQSIVALYGTSATTASGYAGAAPTGRYLSPASGPDCVQYLPAMCPGTRETRIVTGPMFWKVDLSIVKQLVVVKRLRLEAHMDLLNVFDTVNVVATSALGSTVSAWRVRAAATETIESAEVGGRVTSFGLRVSWQ